MILLAVLILLCGVIHVENAGSGTYTSTKHGDDTSGADRSCIGAGAPYSTEYVTGHCGHCHEMHASVGGSEPTPPGAEGAKPYALFLDNYGANRNELCYACHETFDFGAGLGYGRYGIYMGETKYAASDHNTDSDMIWPGSSPPGPAYDDYGNCHNCHNPHGYNDGSGVISHMLFQRDGQAQKEMGCEECHDGSQAAKDIKSQLNQAYSHPTHDYDDRHIANELGVAAFGQTNQHAECVDCHNPHTIGSITPSLPEATHDRTTDRDVNGNKINDTTFGSKALQGAWGVQPAWPAMDQRPGTWDYTVLKPPDYPDGAEYEYQICLKCHSSYADENTDCTGTVLTDPDCLAKAININYTSRHPIVEPLGPQSRTAEMMKNPWKNIGDQTMYCSDCHGDDAASSTRGVHGSDTEHMLRPINATAGSPFDLWPYRADGQRWKLDDVVGNLNNWDTRLFCAACHEFKNPSGDLWGDPLEDVSASIMMHRLPHPSNACDNCHRTNVHGWKWEGMMGGPGTGIESYINTTIDDCHNSVCW